MAISYITPSAAHDNFVGKGILSQSDFVGVCGGNVLDEKHVGKFLRMLESGENGEYTLKTGAVLYFSSHGIGRAE